MNTQHTLGQWYRGPSGDVFALGGHKICSTVHSQDGYLLAAAPELLGSLVRMNDVLKKVLKAAPNADYDAETMYEINEVPLQAALAIAKAQGKTI